MKRFIKIAEANGWSITDDGDNIELSQYSPKGRDFSFIIEHTEDYDDATRAVYNAWTDFDASYETYIWLDESGHGTNGAPYTLEAVLEDSKAIEKMIHTLWYKLN